MLPPTMDWQEYEAQATRAIGDAATIAALEDVRVQYLGRKSELALALLQREGLIKIVADTRTRDGTREVYGGIYPAAVMYATSRAATCGRQGAVRGRLEGAAAYLFVCRTAVARAWWRCKT